MHHGPVLSAASRGFWKWFRWFGPLLAAAVVVLSVTPGSAAVHQVKDTCTTEQPPLPSTPTLKWTTTVSTGLASAVVPAVDGRLLAVDNNARLIQWDAYGRERWARLLPGRDTSAPLVLGDLILLTTHQGMLLGYSHQGVAKTLLSLPLSEPTEPTQLLPIDCATLAIISGSELLIINRNSVRAHVRAPDRIVSAYAHAHVEGVRFVTEAGEYYQWFAHLNPVLVRSVNTAQVVLGRDSLVLVTENGLSEYRSDKRELHKLGTPPAVQLVGRPFEGQDTWLIWTKQGQVAAYSHQGEAEPPSLWPGLLHTRGQQRPPLMMDRTGRAATVTGDGRLVTWRPADGETTRTAPVVCERALSLATIRDATLIVACAPGRIYGFSDGP